MENHVFSRSHILLHISEMFFSALSVFAGPLAKTKTLGRIPSGGLLKGLMPNLPTNTADFRGFDSSIILILRGGILTSVEFDRESPGKFDSRTLNRTTRNRWTGRTASYGCFRT